MRTFAVLVFVIAAVVASPFEAHIDAEATLTNGAAYEIAFSLTNTQAEPVSICVYGTPLDKSSDVLRADMFEVVSDLDVEAVYTGILMKRSPVLSDFITLQPNQTVNAQVDLLKGYWFPKEGEYVISLKSYIYVLVGGKSTNLADFTVYNLFSTENLIVQVLDVIPTPAMLIPNTEENLGAVTPNSNCPSGNASAIRTADSNSVTLVSTARTYLSKACASGYVTWFGTCDSSRYSTVTSHFTSINSRIGSGYRVDCAGPSCSANTYAYVYPTDTTYTVYVCGAFWRAPTATCQYDSQPGTIVHEISHFNSVAGTKDVQYGTTGCQNLAKSNPAQAITNADSHEYFAENCLR